MRFHWGTLVFSVLKYFCSDFCNAEKLWIFDVYSAGGMVTLVSWSQLILWFLKSR